MTKSRIKYTSNIPEARLDLLGLATELRGKGFEDEASQIEQIVHRKMHRGFSGRMKAPKRAKGVTVRIRDEAKRLARETNLPQTDIAAKLGINSGRVSEILNGHYEYLDE